MFHEPEGNHVRASARPCRSTSIAGDDAGFHAGHAPGNRGPRYPADPPKVEEIIAVMRASGDAAHGRRLRGLIVIMWRAGLRIQEAPALARAISIHAAAPVLVRRGNGGRRREVGMDAWGWEQLEPWLDVMASSIVGGSWAVIWRDATPSAM